MKYVSTKSFECRQCGASVGAPCVSKSGKETGAHGDRQSRLSQAEAVLRHLTDIGFSVKSPNGKDWK